MRLAVGEALRGMAAARLAAESEAIDRGGSQGLERGGADVEALDLDPDGAVGEGRGCGGEDLEIEDAVGDVVERERGLPQWGGARGDHGVVGEVGVVPDADAEVVTDQGGLAVGDGDADAAHDVVGGRGPGAHGPEVHIVDDVGRAEVRGAGGAGLSVVDLGGTGRIPAGGGELSVHDSGAADRDALGHDGIDLGKGGRAAQGAGRGGQQHGFLHLHMRLLKAADARRPPPRCAAAISGPVGGVAKQSQPPIGHGNVTPRPPSRHGGKAD